MKDSKKDGGSSKSRITDARFSSFETDPRFRLPSKKQGKTTIDKRFSRMLKDDDFTATAKVDRYGRKIKSDSKKKALQRLYREEEEDEDEEEEDIEVEDDEIVQRELRAAHKSYDPARGGGFSSSESESESDDDEDDEEEGGVGVDTEGDMQRFQDEQAGVETGEVTNRIAIVNLDWDHVKSVDLFAVFSSFLPTSGGRVEKISVYPSEFGKERMQQEEVEGPPKALFKSAARSDSSDEESEASDDESEDEKIKKSLLEEGDDQDFDSDALRSYQLDRLRYYYAVMVCSSPETAHQIYEATDGREYQSSSNFLDLRFVPDDVTFDDQARDECDKIPDNYKPVEFVTNALQSSKVKLTWDMHPEETSRKDSINRAFTGSRAQLDENDLKAYLASDSEDEDGDEEEDVAEAEVAEDEPKLSKKELARRKMREALGLGDEPAAKSKSTHVGDMQITFTPALTENEEAKKKKGDQEETTIEKYKRKERERKERKRQQARAKREGAESDADEPEETEDVATTTAGDDDLGFDDPFFTAAAPAANSKTSVRKEDRRKKREAREAAEATEAAQRAVLEKALAKKSKGADEEQADHLDHFDMNEIIRAEKLKRKKGKMAKKKAAETKQTRGGLQEEFKMDVADDRFKAVFENHEFAIDPSNPKFKATEGMKELLEEGRKKRRAGGEEGDERRSKKVKKGRR